MFTKLYVKAQSLRNEEGATALEYGILVALIALVIIAGVTTYGSALNTYFLSMSAKFPFK